ncbi:SPT2 chromatin protein [Euphorbia peplus]|nr:SPT2 chromatin protein [Euphorbia peplus]
MVEHQYLELREKLKAEYRAKIRRQETGENSGEIRCRVKDNYGTFFGPSETILAPRLMLLETNSDLLSNKSLSSINVDPKTTKNQRIKESRDYSLLLSDNQESKPAATHNGQELGLEKRGSDINSLGTLKKQNMPKVLPENKAKMRQRVKSDLESKTRAKLPKATSPSKLADLKQELRLEKMVYVGKWVGKLKKLNVPQVLPENRAKIQKRVKSELELKTRVKFPEATPPSKLAGVKKSKPVDQKQPLCQNSEKRAVNQKKQPTLRNLKKRALEDDDFHAENAKAFNELRRMFNTERFVGRDDSDRVMEVNFGDIVKEEKRSERLGKKEDAEQLRLIQQEEEAERRQKAKRQGGLVAK